LSIAEVCCGGLRSVRPEVLERSQEVVCLPGSFRSRVATPASESSNMIGLPYE
jgi:hypothetical protein